MHASQRAFDDELCDIACDYLTSLSTEFDSTNEHHKLATAMFRVEADCGNDIKPWGMSGFKGWKCGHVELGKRDHLFMCRLSGRAAANGWKRMVHVCDRVTRIDVQATIKTGCGPTDRIEFHRREALRFCEKHDDVPIARWIRDNRDGYTLYLGSRESNVFGRIYDKYAREKLDHFLGCVRYEVQFNSRLATSIAFVLERMDSPKPGMAGYISQFLEARGVTPPALDASQLTPCVPRVRTDADRKLAWIKESVRPSVLSLIALGRGQEVLEALGLVVDDYPRPGESN